MGTRRVIAFMGPLVSFREAFQFRSKKLKESIEGEVRKKS
jgi:hypothetical protein